MSIQGINYSQVKEEWKEIYSGIDNLKQLYSGINKLCKTVEATMGAKGKTIIIHDGTKDTDTSTKDGVTVAEAINFRDPIENIGANQIKQVAKNVVKAAGDGTTTATVFTAYLTNACIQLIEDKVEPYAISKALDDLKAILLEELEGSINLIESEQDVINIAYIASNSDDEITKLIVEAIVNYKDETVINIEHGSTAESYVKETKGYSIDKGYLNHNFKDPNRVFVEYHNPLIFITKDELVGTYDVEHLLEIASDENRPLVIIAKDFLQDAYNYLAMNKLHRSFPILPIKAPNFGEEQHHILQDLATYTNATLISKDSGFALGSVDLSDFGTCSSVKSGSDYTHIFGGEYNELELNERVAGLKLRLEDTINRDKHDHFINSLKERISKLEGGIVTIYVGGYTTQEVQEKYDRVEDSLLATMSALEEGYIVGGGLFYLKCGMILESDNPRYRDENYKKIMMALAKALYMPSYIIIRNAMLNNTLLYKTSLEDLKHAIKHLPSNNINNWIDVVGEQYIDLKAKGIIDAAKSTRAIINNGIAFTKNFITTHATIVHKLEYFQNIQ